MKRCCPGLTCEQMRAQHYAQCELLPRRGACSPDSRAASQFQHAIASTPSIKTPATV